MGEGLSMARRPSPFAIGGAVILTAALILLTLAFGG